MISANLLLVGMAGHDGDFGAGRLSAAFA